ncbi:MAG: glutamate--cysteine ligase [Streptosporangiaceae bacterium]
MEQLTFGVEEEFLLVDPVTREPVPAAGPVLGRAALAPFRSPGAEFNPELLATQVEAATGVCTQLPVLRRQLRAGRLLLAAAATEESLRLVSAGTPVLPGSSRTFSAGPRFARIAEMYANVVEDYQACGCHVHVGVADRDTAVAVVNHLRPWLPTLLALSANSPFDRGHDSGYTSWRVMKQAKFPGSGIPPWFASFADYEKRLDRLVEVGMLVDQNMTFWLARPSHHLPTVEVRTADAAARVDDAVLQAALTRALVRAALADLDEGREAYAANDQICAAALWSAARYGLDGPGVDTVTEHRLPARELVESLLARARPGLEEVGDLAEVQRLIALPNGASRQRQAALKGPQGVVDMLIKQTVR